MITWKKIGDLYYVYDDEYLFGWVQWDSIRLIYKFVLLSTSDYLDEKRSESVTNKLNELNKGNI
ncbi:MAG: hypothetical protein WC940_03055 [Candidatus Paceibacterota bacterium]|jgi:hypothetical protein